MRESNLRMRILFIVQKRPGIQKSAVCREANRRWRFYCSRRNCYGNPRKRRNFHLFPCVCMYSKSVVFRLIDRMEKEGLLTQRRERKPDGHKPCGWDYMKGVYSTLKIAFGRMDINEILRSEQKQPYEQTSLLFSKGK